MAWKPLNQLPIETAQLGERVGEYRAPRSDIIAGYAVVLVTFGLATFLLPVAAWYAMTDWDKQQAVVWLLLLAGVAALMVGIFVLRETRRRRRLGVLLHAEGVVKLRDGQFIAIRFLEVESLWQDVIQHHQNGIPIHTTHQYTLRRNDGAQVVFDNEIARVKKLGEQLQVAITERLLPLVLKRYRAGEKVSFGRLSVSRDGITDGTKTLPWVQIGGIRIFDGTISVDQQGKWLTWSSVRASEVPNVFVFLALVNEICGVKP